MTGFVTPEGKVWGRPVGITISNDGSLSARRQRNDLACELRQDSSTVLNRRAIESRSLAAFGRCTSLNSGECDGLRPPARVRTKCQNASMSASVRFTRLNQITTKFSDRLRPTIGPMATHRYIQPFPQRLQSGRRHTRPARGARLRPYIIIDAALARPG